MVNKDDIEEVMVLIFRAKQIGNIKAKNEYIDMAFRSLEKIKKRLPD